MMRHPITREEAARIHKRNVIAQIQTYKISDIPDITRCPSVWEQTDVLYDFGDSEVDKMAIIFQPRIIGLGINCYSHWVERRIKKMCGAIIRDKMLAPSETPDDILLPWLESKYGKSIFSRWRISIERGSVRYDEKTNIWYATFRVTSD